MRYDIHFFTGTGNTERSANHLAEGLRAAGHDVKLTRILNNAKPVLQEDSVLVLAYPVYSWVQPRIVRRYVRKLPGGKGRPLAIFCTFGGDPFQSIVQTVRLMKRRGWNVIADGGALYPDNWTEFGSAPDAEEAAEMIRQGDSDTDAFLRALLAGEAVSHPRPQKLAFLTWLIGELFLLVGRRVLGLLFAADSTCTGCSLCARACPAGVIKMKGGKWKRPAWNFSCENCCRCINICPHRSIQTSWTRLVSLGIVTAVGVSLIVALFTLFGKFIPAPFYVLSVLAAVVAGHVLVFFLQFTVADPILFALQSSAGGRKILDWTFTRAFNRYTAPGWKAPLREK